MSSEQSRLDALVDELVEELRARDPALLPRLSAVVPAHGGVTTERGQALYRAARARFVEQAFPLQDGPADALGAVIERSLLDAVRAALGELELKPRPRDARRLEEILAQDYTCTVLPSGRKLYVANWPGRPLLVINAIGIPLSPWHSVLSDTRGPFRPLLVETRAGELIDGGLGSDCSALHYAADLAQALKLSGLPQVDVLAWCNGGRIAIELALRASERIGTLTLLATTLRSASLTTSSSSTFEDNLQKVFEGLRSNPKSAPLMSRILLQLFSPPNWDGYATPDALTAAFLSRPRLEQAKLLSRPMQSGPELVNYAARTAADEASPLREALSALPVPTLLLLGDRDGVIDNAATASALALAPNQTTLVLAGAGHYIQDLQYPYLRAVLERFTRDHERARFDDFARLSVLQRKDARGESQQWRYHTDFAGGSRPPLSRLFDDAARARPDADAVGDGEVTLTFAELARGVRRLARELQARGVKPKDYVCVLAEKRALMPVIAGAIWKAGGVYVPLDHENPPGRTRELLERVAPRALLGSTSGLARAQLSNASAIHFDDVLRWCRDTESAEDHEPAAPATNETDPAYVIFTSGSTGVPKGVVISQGSLLDYFRNHNQVLRVGPDSRVLSFSPFHFDVSIEDTLLPLSLGAFVYQFRGLQVAPLIRKVLKRERITHLIAVSSVLALASGKDEAIDTDAYPALRMVMTGAESCDPRIIDRWVSGLPGARVINAYGPTEATIVCLTHTIERPEPERESTYPIGLPLERVALRLVDEQQRPISTAGVPGELWVGGSQVMLGYLGLDELTAQACPVVDGQRWYRTGDLCERDAQGRYTYLQRLDDMVKISGKRVHLGEIRHRALAIPGIEQTAVGVTLEGERRVIGMVVVSSEQTTATLARVREVLASQLPAYMVPGVIATAAQPRLTANGKADEKGLLLALQAMVAQRGLLDGPLEPLSEEQQS